MRYLYVFLIALFAVCSLGAPEDHTRSGGGVWLDDNREIKCSGSILFQSGSDQLGIDLKFVNESSRPISGWSSGEVVGKISVTLERQDGNDVSEVDTHVFLPVIPTPSNYTAEEIKSGERVDILEPSAFAKIEVSVPVVSLKAQAEDLFPGTTQPFEIMSPGRYRLSFVQKASGLLLYSIYFEVDVFDDGSVVTFQISNPGN